MSEKWMLVKSFALIVLALLILTGVGFCTRIVGMRVEREVMVQSHQYKEGMAERVAVLQANLAEIDARLLTVQDPNLRAGLEAQRSAINAQLIAARR